MLRHMLLVGALVGVVGTGMIGAAPLDSAAPGVGQWRLPDTPLGRMISGNLGRLLVLRSELNVTPEQKAEVRQIVASHRQEIVATVQSVRAKRVALRDAVLAQEADEAAIRSAADELGDAIGEAAVKAAKLKAQLAPVLNAEQQTLIMEFIADRDAAVEGFLNRAAEMP